MSPMLRNILAVVAGIIVGGIVNSAIVGVSGSVIPLPEGVDPNDLESTKAHINDYELKQFLMPWLAHGLGTLVAAFLAVKIAVSRQRLLALIIGGFFMLGGIAAVALIGGPVWYAVADIGLAYIPMALLGWKLAGGGNGSSPAKSEPNNILDAGV